MSETRDEMTLERAIGVLNERCHHGLKWSLWCSAGQTMASVLGEAKGRRDYLLRPDDAIAIAERLERRSEDVTQRLLAYAKGIIRAQDAAKARRAAPAAIPSRDDLGRAAYEAFAGDPERIERFGTMPSWGVLESVRQDFWCRVGEAVAAVVNPGSEVARG